MAISSIDGIAISNIRKIDTSGLASRKATDEEIAQMQEMWENQFRVPVGKADNDPSYTYAKVKVGGKVVATIYASGGTETSNAIGGKIKSLFSMSEKETLTGPALAQKRAEEIAEKLGGTVEKIATPQSLAAWENRPPITWTYDYKAMEAAKARDASAATKYITQELAQKMEDANNAVTDEFMDIAKKSPAERIRDQILRSKNLTEEDLAAMTPEKREAIEKEIAEMIKDKFKEGSKEAAVNANASMQQAVAQGQQAVADANGDTKAEKESPLNATLGQNTPANPEEKRKADELAALEALLIRSEAA